ncbi:putative 3-hydroxylacyl-(Acyl carrier protein) dehydratase-like protein [Thiomonas sp. X19]|uniref:3-hydroxylacyl-ACP dehydratase n=1 Tax=Thiomonas sp. X19 TaxID=1050370 RepID=UPI000B650904|nr:3-hydroxylacyl-ACP dehydratase [Thiomonas sp. X19]SCC92600.1 putative 3-hydroxylacyl-(Acyl carrier protein) dehydratase-like protein [Thiomonas sp. X19]
MLKPARLGHVPLDHAWIAAHIPHQGSMCLLDAVLRWDAQHIVCSATSHRDASNPLRQFDRLGAACGIEYAAQAMAVHGALVAEHDRMPGPGNAPQGGQQTLGRPGGLLVSTPGAAQTLRAPQGGQQTLGRPGGLLVSLRAVQLHVARIDDVAATLEVRVERLSGDAQMLLYQFRVLAADRLLLDGRASVVLDAASLATSFASTPP